MKHRKMQAQSDSPRTQAPEKNLSRRKFLQTAAIAGMAAAAVPAAGNAQTRPAVRPSNTEHPLENILNRYGSEFGNVKRTG